MATIILTLATPDGTGAPRMAGHYAASLQRAGHQVLLVGGQLNSAKIEGEQAAKKMTAELEAEGVECITLPGLEKYYSSAAIKSLCNLAKERDVRAMVSFQPRDQLATLTACRSLPNTSCIISAQNCHHFWGLLPVRFLKRQIFARAMRKGADLVVATSPVVRQEVVDFGVPENRIRILANAINTAPTTGPDNRAVQQLRQSLGLEENDFFFLNVGRIDMQKGQTDLLQAFAAVQPNGKTPKLAIVGGVSTNQAGLMEKYFAECKDIVKTNRLENRVMFTGWRDDVPTLLQAADAYVHSARWEGFPLSVLEAMVARRPTIFTDCAGHPPGFVDGEHGYIVPTANVDKLQAAMQQMMQHNLEKRNQLAAAGQGYVRENYDIATIGKQFVSLVEAQI